MGKEDYVSTGGALKLKGVSSGKIEKKKKKKKASSSSSKPATDATSTGDGVVATSDGTAVKPVEEKKEKEKEREKVLYAGKTEAEKRFLERKEKQVRPLRDDAARWLLTVEQRQERLKREGLKSHKERVEEFNKYLSNLSEHHDM